MCELDNSHHEQISKKGSRQIIKAYFDALEIVTILLWNIENIIDRPELIMLYIIRDYIPYEVLQQT